MSLDQFKSGLLDLNLLKPISGSPEMGVQTHEM
jgi:hypothetical protein